MSPPLAHVADHWAIYIAYSAPAIIVIVAIASAAIRERSRKRTEELLGESDPVTQEERRAGDPANP